MAADIKSDPIRRRKRRLRRSRGNGECLIYVFFWRLTHLQSQYAAEAARSHMIHVLIRHRIGISHNPKNGAMCVRGNQEPAGGDSGLARVNCTTSGLTHVCVC